VLDIPEIDARNGTIGAIPTSIESLFNKPCWAISE
jgi:hypothetical protein